MGVETVITCDKCGKNLKGEDYISLNLKFELDHNYPPMIADERHSSFGVFCENHGREVWDQIRFDS